MIDILKIGLWLIFCSFHLTLVAQKTSHQAIFYMKDGSVFIGNVLNKGQYPAKMVLQTLDTISVNRKLIKKQFWVQDDILLHSRGKYHYKNGYFAAFNLTQSLGIDNENTNIDLLFGTRLNEKYSLGGMFGYHYYFTTFPGFWADQYFLSVGPYGRYYVGKTKARLFLDMGLGYSFPAEQDNLLFNDQHTGGPFFQPGLGFHFASRSKIRWVLGLVQRFQYVEGQSNRFDFFNNPVNYDYRAWINSLSLKIGIEFR